MNIFTTRQYYAFLCGRHFSLRIQNSAKFNLLTGLLGFYVLGEEVYTWLFSIEKRARILNDYSFDQDEVRK